VAKQTQLDFELGFFASILAQSPNYVEVLRAHGHNLTAKGLYAKGLDADRRLAQLRPRDPLVHYNLACSYSLLNMKEAAIMSLESSLQLGYRDFEHMLHDPDLEHVRHDVMGLIRRFLRQEAGKV
jgi:Flp pilus assembly protein TadD